MKKGINIWSFKNGTQIIEALKIAKNAGFDGIELALEEKGEINLNTGEKKLLEIKRAAEDIKIELPSLASGLYWKYSLTSADKNTRDKAKFIVKKQLEAAAILGADTILVVPGAVGVDFIPGFETVDYDKAYDASLEAFMELKEEAEKYQISIGIENVWNKFLLSPLEMRDFLDKIGSGFVGTYLDVGNVIYSGYPEQWIKILGKRIKKLHFKDFKRSIGTLSGFVELIKGDVDFPRVMNELKNIGYDDYATAEMIPNYQNDISEIIYNTSGAMDKILGRK